MHRISKRHRRGAFLVEAVAAAFILTISCALLAQMLFLAAKQERVAEARQIAGRAAANQLEKLMAKNWDELPAVDPKDEPAPPEVLQLLPNAKLRTRVTAHEAGFVREVRVEIAWQDKSGMEMEPISLAAWKHRPAAEAQP
jgi:hypothetical protein